MWMRISGALQKKINAEFTYKQVARASSDENSLTAKQIEKVIMLYLDALFSESISQYDMII